MRTYKRGFTLIELMIVIAIIAVIAAIAIPGLLAAQRSSNERNASASLKTLTSAEADFRSNDRDADRQNNFWTDDVYALYALCPSTDGLAVPTASVQGMIKLIEPSIAGAEASITAGGSGIVIPSTAVGIVRSPKAGYLYSAFTTDEFVLGYNTATTGVAYTPFHNYGKFAFLAMPSSASAGKSCFIVNEDNTIYKGPLATAFTAVFSPDWAAAGLGTITGMTVTGGAGTWNANATTYPACTWPGATATTGPTEPPGRWGFSKMD